MKSGYADNITKRELKDMGFVDVKWRDDIDNWVMCRYWHKNNSKRLWHYYELEPELQVNKLDNGNIKEYWKFTWSYKSVSYSTTASRIAKAWHARRVPKGKVIDHKNNKSKENDWKNLRIKSIKANNRKRFKDNPGHKCFNQYKNTKTVK